MVKIFREVVKIVRELVNIVRELVKIVHEGVKIVIEGVKIVREKISKWLNNLSSSIKTITYGNVFKNTPNITDFHKC